tara:strand:- start:1450 stop:2163 length:714 start_codon:yes stop_codon:yes gene_type:complete
MLTVNDLIGLNYSNLRNPITPRQDMNRNQPFLNSSYPQPEFFPNDQQGSLNVDMGATGTIPTAAKLNPQPLINETSGIAPLLISDTNMPLDYEEMIQRDDSIITPKRKTSGLENLLQLAISAAIPGAGLLMRGPKGLAGLNRRIQQSDFGQATSLADYLDMQRYGGLQGRLDAAARNMAQARGIQKKIDSGMYDDKGSGGIGDRGRGQTPTKTTSSKKSTSRQSRQTSGSGGLHSNY